MNRSILNSICLTLLLILTVLLAFLPVLLVAVLGLMLLLRYRAGLLNQTVHKYLMYLLSLAGLAIIYFNYQTYLGVEAGVAVMSLFLFAKAMETQQRRDQIVLFNYAFFVSACAFLFSQSIAMAIGVLACLISGLVGLYRIQLAAFTEKMPQAEQHWRSNMRYVGQFLLYALPFFLLLFLFFPRLPPLWYIPVQQQKAVTGMSDQMSPGDIAQLSQSNALAFRIVGDLSQFPPRSTLYWRALVLDQYDGQRWTSHPFNQQQLLLAQQDLAKLGQGVDYSYLPSDPSVTWVMGLDKSVPLQRPYYSRQDWGIGLEVPNSRQLPIQLRWLGQQPVSEIYQQDFQLELNRRYQLKLDSQAQQLAKQLWQQSQRDPQQYIQYVLNWYQQQGFQYTLTPELLGENRVDDFLFKSRKGFCEHYASSFAMLMRYVGIPARVVVGYQGGQQAPDGQSWEVRQLDAHAWNEVWLHDQWIRVDPTAVIAPERIESGMRDLINTKHEVMREQGFWSGRSMGWMTQLRVWSDFISYQWQSKVIGYDSERQRHWLSLFGLNSAYALGLILLASIGMVLLMYVLIILRRQQKQFSPLQRIVHQFNCKLPESFKRQQAETVRHWLFQLAEQVTPQQQEVFKQTVERYEEIHYAAGEKSSEDLQQLQHLFKTCADIIKSLQKGL